MDAKEVLQGDSWLGHPVHPALVAVPIGSWIFSLVMDGLAAVTKNECAQEAADKAITVGLVGAGLSAATGIAEFARTKPDSEAQSSALLHGSLNAAGMALYGINAAVRSARRASGRPTGVLPKFLSLVGVATVTFTGFLGGDMAFRSGVGVQIDKVESQENPPEIPRVPERRREREVARARM